MKECIYCNREISKDYLSSLKDIEEIRCPYCYKELKATNLSRLIYFSLCLFTTLLIYISPLKLFSRIILFLLWVFISIKYLKTRIYQYEEI